MAQIDLGKVVGRSAYELAVENGFEGTEQEWLASLHGEKGDPGQDAENYQVLATKEEVQGNVESGKLVDALVIKEVFQSVSDGKGAIASAITDKGVQTDAEDTFAVMAENIGQISTGDGTGSGGGHFDDPYPMQAYFSGYIASKSGQYRTIIRSAFTIKKAKKILIRSIKVTASIVYASASASYTRFYFEIYGYKDSVKTLIKRFSVASSSTVGGTPGKINETDIEIDVSDYDSIEYWEINTSGPTSYVYIYSLSLDAQMEVYT